MFVYAEIRLSHLIDRALKRCCVERVAQKSLQRTLGTQTRNIGLICVSLLSVTEADFVAS